MMPRLDRDPPQPDSSFANEAEIAPADRALLESAAGRQAPDPADADSAFDEEVRSKSIGGGQVSDRTNFHTSGTGAIETDDGLDETTEVVRQMAEDVPDQSLDDPSIADDNVMGDDVEAGLVDAEDVPVFDRSRLI